MVFEVRDMWRPAKNKMSGRNERLSELVEEVSKDHPDQQKVRDLLDKLSIPYSDNEIELLNNILRGIHDEGPSHEGNV